MKDWVTLISVAYPGYGRHGTCHGRHVDGGRKNCLAKLKSLCTVFQPLFCAPCIHKLQSCINTASSPKAFRRACCASTTKHYDKIAVLWHNTRVRHRDRTRTLACHVHEASSFSRYKRG